MAYKCPTITIPGYTVTCEYVSNNNGKTYTSGQTLPTVDEADEFQIVVSVPDVGDYCMCNFMYAKANDDKILAGWTLYDVYPFRDTINYKIPIPSSINGKNVTQYAYYRQFGGDGLLDSTAADKLITGPVLPSGLKDISSCFKGCINLQGLLEVNCNPTYYSNWLTGRTSSSPSLKLYGTSTMLSTLASGYSNVSVYIKMQAQLLAQRCNSSHQLDDEGTSMKLSLKIKGDNVGVNYTAAIKVNNSLVMTKGFTLNSSAEQTIVWYIDNTYSIDATYAVSATITSKCSGQTMETLNVSDTLTTAFFTMDIGNKGKEIAFGQSATTDQSMIPSNGLFSCGMSPIFFSLAGEIKMWAGDAIPYGWLLCDGSEVSKTKYPNLYAAIGDLWGVPSSSSNFKLPNLTGRVPVGYNSADTDTTETFGQVGATGGARGAWYHTHTIGSSGAHNHASQGRMEGSGSGANIFESYNGASKTRSVNVPRTGTNGNHTHSPGSSGSAGNKLAADKANMPPYAVVKYIICAI